MLKVTESECKAAMKWSEAVTLKFVKIYLKHECLWNPSNPGYKLKYKRDTAYSDICSEFKSCTMKSMSIPEVKMKIKNLRTTYVQQVHKILQKSSPDYIYEPSLVWFHEMDRCLKHIPTNRHSAFNSSQKTPEVDSSCQIWVDQESHNDNEDELNSGPLTAHTDDDYDDSSRPEETISQMKKERQLTSYKKIKKKKFKHRIPVQNYLTDSDTINEDEFDIYGKFIAAQLRKMDLQKALKLQLHIHTLVSEARISDIVDYLYRQIVKRSWTDLTNKTLYLKRYTELLPVVAMRWSEDETYKFVKLYLSHEHLWNSGHPGYKFREKRIQAYRTLISEFRNVTGIFLSESELKVKIKNLKSTYTQELTKIIHRSAPDCAYKPTIKWFALWHKCFKNTTRKRIEDPQYEEEDQQEDPSEKIWVTEGMENVNEETDGDPFVSQADEDYGFILKSEPSETQVKIEDAHNTYKMKRKKMKRRSPSTDQSDQTFRGSMDSSVDAKEDEFDIYGKYIASQLRQMDLQKALKLQLDIQSLVSEARITDLTRKH
ncbi:uncharacterized protein [Epargyreus clarus]|uniref:uncharacterized protein n=1 Tax=Epargyreus clarus TaxID=520877 RepID=UPI003C2D3FC3